MNKLFFLMIFIVLVNSILAVENSFNHPDSLYIQFFDTKGCIIEEHILISINYANGKGIIYTYGFSKIGNVWRNVYRLKKGTITKDNINKITNVLFQYNIENLKENQFDPDKPLISTDEGKGKMIFVIKKGNKLIKKQIQYPTPGYNSLENNFYKIYIKLQILTNSLTHYMTVNELKELLKKKSYDNIGLRDYKIKEFVKQSIKYWDSVK